MSAPSRVVLVLQAFCILALQEELWRKLLQWPYMKLYDIAHVDKRGLVWKYDTNRQHWINLHNHKNCKDFSTNDTSLQTDVENDQFDKPINIAIE